MSDGFLQGRVAVVTGASRGLGKPIAESLAAAGASVALVARNRELLESVASGIRGNVALAELFIDSQGQLANGSVVTNVGHQYSESYR